MSGRLILLPKKSYTPWNRENVERVLRDERLERERLQNKQEKSDLDASKRRIDALKRQKRVSQNNTNANESIRDRNEKKHYNLFEKEEQKMLEEISIPKKNEMNKCRLDDSFCKHKNETRVYLNHYSMISGTNYKLSEQSESKIKQQMDPMNSFFSKEIPSSYGHNHRSLPKIVDKKIISQKIHNQCEHMNMNSKTQPAISEQFNQSLLEPKRQCEHQNTYRSVNSESSNGIEKRHHSDRRKHHKRKRKSHKRKRHHKSKKKKRRKQNSESDLSNDDCYDSCSSFSSISYSKEKKRKHLSVRHRS